jgi:hypothetical protein
MLSDDNHGNRSTFIPMPALIQRLDKMPEWQTHLFGNASLIALLVIIGYIAATPMAANALSQIPPAWGI